MLSALLLLSVALAQDLGLREAVERASDAPSAALLRAEAAAGAARARGLATPSEDPTIHLEQEPDARRLTLELPLDLALPARLSASGSAKESAALQAERARIAPGLDVAALWLEARAARDRADATAWMAQGAQQSADAARARRASGEIAADEAALLLADAVTEGASARDAEAAALAATRRLQIALGEAPDARLSLADWEPVPDPPPLAPGLAARQAELTASASDGAAQVARAERLPALSLTGGWQQSAPEDGVVLGLSLGLPLYGAREAQAARADALAAHAAADLAALADQEAQATARQELALALQASEAWAGLDLRGALEAATLRFERGEIGPGEALARRSQLSDALLGQIDARYRLERARLQLWALAGQLPWGIAP